MSKSAFHLSIDGADAGLVVRLSGQERLSGPFSFLIELAGGPGTDALDWVGVPADLTWDLSGGGTRSIRCIVDTADVLHGGSRVALVPPLAALTDASDHRVFVGLDTLAIVNKVLDEHGLEAESRVGRSLPVRPQCIQKWEADLDFVTRLLAEEGIAWFLAADGETIVLADEPRGFDEGRVTLPVREEAGMEAGESVFPARLAGRLAPDAVTLGEYDFARPALDLSAKASAGRRGLRHLQFPRGYPAADVGGALAAIRLQEARRDAVSLRGTTTHRGLRPGLVITLDSAADARLNARWLVVEVEHEARDIATSARPYEARFCAVPAEGGYRPARVPPPRLGGVETATIAGPSGAEIHPDEHARVRLRHRWDERAPGDETSSAWARTVQPAMSGGVLLPRVGWEALVAFGGATGDDPWILGRLDNGVARPAETQPAKKVWSALGTPTTPGGGSVNRFAFDDTAGNEGMHFVASSALEESTANDKVSAIKADDTWSIGGARTLSVGKVLGVAVEGAQSVSVGGSRDMDVSANKSITCASHTVAIGGLRKIDTGGDLATMCSTFLRAVGGAHVEAAIEHQTRLVLGTSIVATGGAWATIAGPSASIGVGGASVLAVAGPKSVSAAEMGINARSSMAEVYASCSVSAGATIGHDHSGLLSYTAGSATWSGPKITFKAKGITISAAGVTISIGGGCVIVKGSTSSSIASALQGSTKFH